MIGFIIAAAIVAPSLAQEGWTPISCSNPKAVIVFKQEVKATSHDLSFLCREVPAGIVLETDVDFRTNTPVLRYTTRSKNKGS